MPENLDDAEQPHDGSLLTRYNGFMMAITSRNFEKARTFITTSSDAPFTVTLPQRGKLPFNEFVLYMERLFGITSNFGQHYTIMGTIEEGDRLAVHYRNAFNLDNGGSKIQYEGVDWLEFTPDGQIMTIFASYDPSDNLTQIG